MQSDATANIQNQIDEDLECIVCGYNLRSRALDSICPECAAPVIDSMVPMPPAYRLRRESAIRWVRVGLAVWVLSILTWAVGICYCTYRVAYAGEIRTAARWSLYTLIQDDIAWIVEAIAILCLASGIAIEMQGRRRIVACIATFVGAIACVLGIITTYLILTGRQALLGGYGFIIEPITEFGRPAAIAMVCALIFSVTKVRRSALIRASLLIIIGLTIFPSVATLIAEVRALLTGYSNFSSLSWMYWSKVQPGEAISYILITLGIVAADRGLRKPPSRMLGRSG